ncbi:peptidoglycan DD-metalloendopeptidase family protein [Phytoactinopolyspora mesophila]|uniref:peptidoglycan DD-metalloendopeptidase family protein n=1 Tax=Phytoactinopolyspora mesophila TaxID=2650750 RepID=UPI001391DF9B|nr:peptidoglycan DD-metalloendopeptidase family protein [Phytoactinopolyspora mesophila]
MNPIIALFKIMAIVSMLAVAEPADATGRWVYPVGPPHGPADVARGFDPPEQPWGAGHRGVDLRAPEGSEVRAGGSGRITYAGMLAGRGVVVIDHGTLRTTYEPVDASVRVGARITAGEPIGSLSARGSHCAPASCLHWGAIRGNTYVDPLDLISVRGTRLLPLGQRAITEKPPPPPDPPPVSGELGWPVRNPYVTSPYGLRTHPITGERKLHDGTDFRARCGTPILASASGRVTGAGPRGAYGLQVSLDHGRIGDITMATSYSHLSRFAVRQGQSVRSGEVIGWSGNTGLSTGCHLHFMVYAGGSLSDPMTWLPARTQER